MKDSVMWEVILIVDIGLSSLVVEYLFRDVGILGLYFGLVLYFIYCWYIYVDFVIYIKIKRIF